MFGVILLGVAFWMISRILPLTAVAVGWGVLAIGIGVWLAAIGTARPSPAGRWPQSISLATASVLTLYGVLLASGGFAGWYDPLRPLAWAGIAPPVTAWRQGEDGVQIVTNEVDLDDAIAAGRAEGRRILIDFSADWCTECRLMERTVLAEVN